MTRDTEELVAVGYSNLMPIFKNTTLLISLLVYQVITQVQNGTPKNIAPMITVPLFPIAMALFLRFRTKPTQDAEMLAIHCQNAMVEHAVSIFQNFPMIADYNRRPLEIE